MLAYKDMPISVRKAINLFFRRDPHRQLAYPCGHDDICDYVNSFPEVAGKKDPRCKGCDSHIDLERWITRRAFYQAREGSI